MNKKEFLNSKGFTLVELLATIVILAIISGIATYGVIGAINKSKAKSEQIFVDKLSNLIDDYLDLNPPSKDIICSSIAVLDMNDLSSVGLYIV